MNTRVDTKARTLIRAVVSSLKATLRLQKAPKSVETFAQLCSTLALALCLVCSAKLLLNRRPNNASALLYDFVYSPC